MFKLKVIEKIFSPSFLKDGKEKPYSEDNYYISDDMITVLDGATGLSDRRIINADYSDANWFVKEAVYHLKDVYDKEKSPKDMVKELINKLMKSYEENRLDIEDIKNYELPSSTFLMVSRFKNNIFNITTIADGVVSIVKKNGEVISSKPSEFLTKRGEFLESSLKNLVNKGMSLDEAVKKIRLEARGLRNKKNKPDTYGVLDLSLDVLNHKDFKNFEVKLEKGDKIFMTTDGLLRFSESYGLGGFDDLLKSSFKSLSKTLEDVRNFEKQDLDRVKVPRFKISDDICAITIEVV